ncbi:MAG TPA: GGDEF domain-containing protein [Vicinamibacteria bacterium]
MADSLLDDLRQDLRAPADPRAAETAAQGERLVARVRLGAVAALLVLQLLPVGPSDLTTLGWAVLVLALAYALAAPALLARPRAGWMAVLGSVMDVSLVSLGLLSYALVGGPLFAVRSVGLFETYFAALIAGGLRQSWRLVALSAALALGQYGALLVWAGRQGPLDWKRQGYRLALLAGCGALTALVVLHAARLRRLSTVDRLTGLRSRAVLEERLAGELIRAQRYHRPLAVAICDVDDLRRFNDEYGHERGDGALQALASLFGQSFRRTDVVARQGGEFALLLPETRAGDAWHKLEALRLAVAATPVGSRPGRPPATLTLSVGVAAWPGDGEDAITLLAAADTRLYEAKTAGRNRVIGPPPATPPRGLHPAAS